MLTFRFLFLSLIIHFPHYPLLCLLSSPPRLPLSLSTASSHSLAHLLLLMKRCIIRIPDCRTVTGPIGPSHMCVRITRNPKHTHTHTHSASICTKPFSIWYTHMHMLCKTHSGGVGLGGLGSGGGSWSYQREGNQSCNWRAYRGKRVRPYLTRQQAQYVSKPLHTHKHTNALVHARRSPCTGGER